MLQKKTKCNFHIEKFIIRWGAGTTGPHWWQLVSDKVRILFVFFQYKININLVYDVSNVQYL